MRGETGTGRPLEVPRARSGPDPGAEVSGPGHPNSALSRGYALLPSFTGSGGRISGTAGGFGLVAGCSGGNYPDTGGGHPLEVSESLRFHGEWNYTIKPKTQ